MDSRETAAGQIAAAVLGGEAKARDVPGAPEMTHDFDIVLPDGRVVALEVTSATKGEIQQLRAAAIGRDYTTDRLANDWWIVVGERHGGEQVNIRKLIRGIIPVLEVYERHGITEDIDTKVSPRYRKPPAGTTQDVIDAMTKQHELGAAAARPWGPRRTAKAQLFVSVSGGFTASIDKVNDLVEVEANANSRKLAAASADERHLFIWLSETHADAELAAYLGGPPSSPPHLPQGIDLVWLAAPTAPRFWRVRPPATWEVLDPAALQPAA